jgi:hypothetical protein
MYTDWYGQQSCVCDQFGNNRFGDRDEFLPTVHVRSRPAWIDEGSFIVAPQSNSRLVPASHPPMRTPASNHKSAKTAGLLEVSS